MQPDKPSRADLPRPDPPKASAPATFPGSTTAIPPSAVPSPAGFGDILTPEQELFTATVPAEKLEGANTPNFLSENEMLKARIAALEAQLAVNVQPVDPRPLRRWLVEVPFGRAFVVDAVDEANAWDAYRRVSYMLNTVNEIKVSPAGDLPLGPLAPAQRAA